MCELQGRVQNAECTFALSFHVMVCTSGRKRGSYKLSLGPTLPLVKTSFTRLEIHIAVRPVLLPSPLRCMRPIPNEKIHDMPVLLINNVILELCTGQILA